MEQFGVLAEALGEAQDGVEADLTQARRRTGAGAIGEVLGDGDQFLRGGTQAQERGVGARGEVLAAGSTAQAADALTPARPAMQAQVALAALAVGRAIRVRTGQVREVVGAHRFPPSEWGCCYRTRPGWTREALRSHHRFSAQVLANLAPCVLRV